MSTDMDLANSMRQGMRHLASGVAVVATRDDQGNSYAMTVSSITSLTANPASLLVCLNEDSNTHGVLQQVGQFSVSVLSQDQQDVSENCSITADTGDRFSVGDWAEYDDLNLPYLEGSLSVFFCQVNQKINYGTHSIIIGDIQSVKVDENDLPPLVYCRGAYRSLS